MRNKMIGRSFFAASCAVLALGLVAVGLFRCEVDKSDRAAFMRSMYAALSMYAHDHDGRFPVSESGPYDALRLLYPDYVPIGSELAGVSGSIPAVLSALQIGMLSSNETSWVYVQGLITSNDHRIAVLWERQFGLYGNGRKADDNTRAVLLIGGDITNVHESAWRSFLADQESLRSSIKDAQSGGAGMR